MSDTPVADALEHLYDALGVDPDAPVVAVDPAKLKTVLADHRRMREQLKPADGGVG